MIDPQHIEAVPGPRYRAIADALADYIAAGGEMSERKLPTHRALARQLGVTVNTVTRAYAELGRRGLIAAQVGRGTFVNPLRQRADQPPVQPRMIERGLPSGTEKAVVNLARIKPPLSSMAALAPVLRNIADEIEAPDAAQKCEPASRDRCFAAVKSWLREIFDLMVGDDSLVLTGDGRRGALHAVLASLTAPGDSIVCEPVTFPGLRPVAGRLGLKIATVEADDDGMLPDALEIACWHEAPRVLYLTPTFHDATGATMPESRRRRIADIARVHGSTVVEDGFLGVLARDAPPLFVQLAAPATVFLTGFSPALSSEVETGIVVASPETAASITHIVGRGTSAPQGIDSVVAMRAIETGAMAGLLEGVRTELAARQDFARKMLGLESDSPGMAPPHLWVNLPPPWRAAEFVGQLRTAGVAVESAETFVPDRSAAPHAVRLALGGARSKVELQAVLRVVAGGLRSRPWRGGFAMPTREMPLAKSS
jgi:DNA-binding transcriptional MocR family regulator